MSFTVYECIPCLVRQAAEAVEMCAISAGAKEKLLRKLLCLIAESEWGVLPVAISQQIQRTIRDVTGEPDPYLKVKREMNQVALSLMPMMREYIDNAEDGKEAAVRAVIAGNLLDAGAKVRLTPEELPEKIKTIGKMLLHGEIHDLFKAAEKACCILYLADNAGEIVFDKLLLEMLPMEKITVAVRGVPVLNDATMEDAEFASIPEIVPVISNGSDAPGTIIEECSEEFRHWLDRAGLIVAKGQGNFETLTGKLKNIFFLFTVKCPIVAEMVGAPLGSLVVRYEDNGEDK